MELPDWIEDTPQNLIYVKRVIEACKNDIISHVDGYYYYYPSDITTQGLMGSNDLKVLAWYIEKLNEPYEKQLKEYFKERDLDETEKIERELGS